MESLNVFNQKPTRYFAPENEIGGKLPSRSNGPVFQFYKDLPTAFIDIEIKQVTDQFRIIGSNKDGISVYYNEDGLAKVDEGITLLSINDNLMVISDGRSGKRIGVNGNYLPLKCSPVMRPSPVTLNSEGKIGGSVLKEEVSYARIWDENGEAALEEKTPNSEITVICQLGFQYAAGHVGKDAALWINRSLRILRGPNGERAIASHVNGSGHVGGSFTDGDGIQHACGWDCDGKFCDLGLPLGGRDSYVIGLLVDGTYLVESPADEMKNDYFIGRPGEMSSFDSSSIHTVENFPLVSIDGVSPTGVMVARVKNPDLDRLASILIAPEAARRNQKDTTD